MYIKLYYIFYFKTDVFFFDNFFKEKYIFFLKILHNLIYKFINAIFLKKTYIVLYVKNSLKVLDLLFFFKNNLFFHVDQMLDLSIIDNLERSNSFIYRFEYFYLLNCIFFNIRIFLKGFLKIYDYLYSVIDFFDSANWLEREVWDMYGIFIKNHPNLRRILSDYGFNGYPLRKDFPLSGYIEVRYDELTKSIIIEALELMQEYRFFKLDLPWQK